VRKVRRVGQELDPRDIEQIINTECAYRLFEGMAREKPALWGTVHVIEILWSSTMCHSD
jgi:hypothetical protein